MQKHARSKDALKFYKLTDVRVSAKKQKNTNCVKKGESRNSRLYLPKLKTNPKEQNYK